MTDITLDDYFGGSAPSEELYRVILHDGLVSGDITLSESLIGFEYIEAYQVAITDPELIRDGAFIFAKEYLVDNQEWVINSSDATTDIYQVFKVSNGGTTLIQTAVSPFLAGLTKVIGYKKRYATKNSSQEIILSESNTTGGTFVNGEVQVDQRYEIDIATVLGADYLGVDLIVHEEIYNNSGGGVEDWGRAGFVYIAGAGGYGTSANTLGDKIIVQTGSSVLSAGSNGSGNPFGNSGFDIISTQCRIKVWTVEQYVTNNTLALITDLQDRLTALESA